MAADLHHEDPQTVHLDDFEIRPSEGLVRAGGKVLTNCWSRWLHELEASFVEMSCATPSGVEIYARAIAQSMCT
jgi:hypothetical protein